MFDKIEDNNIIVAFLDTSVIDPMHNNYRGLEGQFETLIKYVNTNKLVLFTHEIVIEEITKHIKETIPNTIARVLSLRNCNEFAVLKGQNGYEWINNDYDKEKLIKDIINSFHTLRKRLKMEIMKTGTISVKQLLSDYFSSKPPFGKKEKKSEFPDAIMAQSIKRDIKNGGKIHIVSSDEDWHSVVETTPNLIYHKTISDLLDYINKDNEIAEDIKSFLHTDDMVNFCKTKIQGFIESMDFTVDGKKYDRKGDTEGFEYDEVELIDIEIDEIQPQAIEDIDYSSEQENNIKAIVTILGSALLTLRCSYLDEENSIWDSETHEYLDEVYGTNKEVHEFLIPLRLYISGASEKELKIDDVKIIETQYSLSALDWRTRLDRIPVDDYDYYMDEPIGFRVDRVFRCPFCEKDIKVNLISGDTECIGADERQMGPEREYKVEIIDECPHCHKEYHITGSIWEYPELCLNDEQDIKIIPLQE